MSKVCLLGMGFVGVTLGAVLAEKGHRVFGVDVNPDVISMLAAGKPVFHEKGLPELLGKNSGRFTFHTGIPSEKMDCIIICVGTPVGHSGNVDNSSIKSAAEMVAKALHGGELVVLRSTVGIGASRGLVKPILDAAGKKYYLAFCPERTVEGKAVAEISELPQIVGGIDEASVEKAVDFFSEICAEMVRTNSIEEAEVVKLLNNSYRDLTFAFANEAAIICALFGISAHSAIKAANHNYKRSNIPSPGFVGGICLSKDSHILAKSVKNYPIKHKLVEVAREVNDYLPKLVSEKIRGNLPPQAAIFVTGIAFKGMPETDDIRGSPAIALIRDLQANGYVNIACHDFVVPEEKLRVIGIPCVSFEEGINAFQCIVVANNNIKYTSPEVQSQIKKLDRKVVVVDVWNLVPYAKAKSITYITL